MKHRTFVNEMNKFNLVLTKLENHDYSGDVPPNVGDDIKSSMSHVHQRKTILLKLKSILDVWKQLLTKLN